MEVNKKSKTDLFLNSIHARLRKILEKEPQKWKENWIWNLTNNSIGGEKHEKAKEHYGYDGKRL